jgi:DNA-binding NarL/FixJ family response regulator
MLKGVGFDEIFECGDGETTVTMALNRLPDIAILDISMPRLMELQRPGKSGKTEDPYYLPYCRIRC